MKTLIHLERQFLLRSMSESFKIRFQDKQSSIDNKIWHGDQDTAILTNEAGEWSSVYAISKMFDSNPQSCWHSGKDRADSLKIIAVHFKVSAKSFHFKSNIVNYLLL